VFAGDGSAPYTRGLPHEQAAVNEPSNRFAPMAGIDVSGKPRELPDAYGRIAWTWGRFQCSSFNGSQLVQRHVGPVHGVRRRQRQPDQRWGRRSASFHSDFDHHAGPSTHRLAHHGGIHSNFLVQDASQQRMRCNGDKATDACRHKITNGLSTLRRHIMSEQKLRMGEVDGPSQSADDALHEQRDWLRVTLSSIGDAVITTDTEARVTFLNPVAESLTGWTQDDAYGKPLDAIFKIINQETRNTVESPTVRALRDGVIVGLANHTLLISKDGTERPIDDSAAPIRNDKGTGAGVVLVFRDISERYRQEQTIQDTLNYANNIIATLREPFLVIGGDLRVHTANRSFYANFHVTPGETEGRLIYELGNGQWDIPRLRAVLGEVLTEHRPVTNYEVEHDFPTIGRRFMMLNALRIRKPGNNSNLILLAIEDITDRKRLERQNAELLKDARFLASIVESSDDAIISKSLDGIIQSWNAAAERLFGHTAEQAVGSHVSLLIPADRISEEDQITAHLRAGERVDQFETVRLRSDGQPIHVSLTISPIQDESGRVIGASKIVRDITERKRAAAALALSEIRYRRLFEAAKDGILILDTHHGRITDANPFMCQLLGYSHNDFMGKELWEIGLFSDKSANEAAVRELQQNGYARYEHLPLESRRGQRVEVEVVANVYQEDHQPVIQCNIRDISERSRLEKRMKEQAAALADLHRRKDEFLAMLSHELRNPLAPISNAVQLLRLQENEDQLQQQARTIIERQVGQLKLLIDDLLEVSRITTGRIQLHQERVVVSGIVERALETARPLMKQHRHELTVTIPPQPIWLYADAARLEQVVVNLLTNATKYTDEGGHIWLTVEQEGDEAVLRVRDTGVGIAPELLPRIFDLFTQAERSLARSEGGLGIGLALVQRLVELHRGRVEAHSSLGRGSEFVVRLPVVLTPAPPPLPSTKTNKPTDLSLRVLVVDDNVDSAESMAMVLRASRHEVRTIHDGPTALEAALDYRPDVVLLDIGLPKLDGYEVAKKLRQQLVLKNVVLVAMTGYGQESDRQRSREAGFNYHLVKPVDQKQLSEVLATVTKQHQQ
jgi:PAS domain S-box-containing protein